jgi:hypothetical protein
MKVITSAIIAIALTLAAGLGVGESGTGASGQHATPDVQVQGYANLTVTDLLRM